MAIPHFDQPQLSLGPLTIHGFGAAVAVAVLVGVRILQARAHDEGLAAADVGKFVSSILLGGFVGAHLIDRLVYFPGETLADPLSLFKFWQGLSSFGGFVGGTIGAFWFFRRHARPGTAWAYVESFAYAFPFGWIFGRLGCFMAYDHPGLPTTLPFGQVYRDGVVRHNLGLEEAIYTVGIAAIFYLLGRRRRFSGFFLSLLLVLYAPFRFGIDFLRIVDVRYLGLTPAQYGCISVFTLGLAIAWRRREKFSRADVDFPAARTS